MKLEAKFPFLMSTKSEMYKLWARAYPEANAYIMKNRYISIRRRLVQWCASKHLWWLVSLHYLAIDKIIYGCIYR